MDVKIILMKNSRAKYEEDEKFKEDTMRRKLEFLFSPKFKGSFQVGGDNFFIEVKQSYGDILDRLLKTRISLETSGMLFPRNHKLFEVFDEKIQRLLTAGIIDHYTYEWFRFLDPKRYKHLKHYEPKKLKMDQLEAGFVVWLVSIAIAFVVFIVEWLIQLRKYLVFYCMISAWFNLIKF